MKKKLLIGLSSVGLAAGFWACGDGTVEPLNEATDGYVKAMLETQSIDFATQVADAKKKCAEDPACENEMAKAQGSAVVISAESSDPLSSSSGISPLSSSSSMTIFKFSSGGDVGLQSSSSAPSVVVSSSSVEEEKPMEGMGRCFPSATTAEQGAAVTWSIEWNKQVVTDQDLFQSPKYNWTFDDGATPATATTKSASVSYSKSGPHSASVAVSVANGTKKSTLVCDKTVNVNGAPITGCKCTVTGGATSVDFNTTPEVSWSVGTTCQSTVSPLVYEWDGVVGETAFTKEFSAAVNSYAPKLKVSHSDNTIVEVQCPAVKITDGPEYKVSAVGDTIKVPNEGCVTLAGTALSNGKNVRCTHGWQTSSCTYTISAGTTTVKQTQDNCNISPGDPLAVSAIQANNATFCVSGTGIESVVCKVNDY